jgi:putative tricarboxylic transport membrane protein
MTKRERDRITSPVWFVAGLAICFGAYRLSLGSFSQPGPGFFAFLAGTVIAVLSCIVFMGARKAKPGGKSEAAGPPLWQNKRGVTRMIYVVILLVFFTVGMDYLGFGVSTLLLLGITLRIVGPQPWRTVLICSILGSFSSWFIFKYWLDVQLPTGIIGF